MLAESYGANELLLDPLLAYRKSHTILRLDPWRPEDPEVLILGLVAR